MFTQIVLSGIVVGSIYALVALGFVVVYRSVAMFNFAQTEYYTLGGMLFSTLLSQYHVPFAIAIVLTMAVAAIVGIVTERLAFRRLLLLGTRPANLIIVSLALAVVLRSIILLIWGTDARNVATLGNDPVVIAGMLVTRQQMFIVVSTIIVVSALQLFLHRTRLGLALRATASNRTMAGLMGIPLATMLALSFAISAGIGALGGILVAPILLAQYSMGQAILVKAFAAAVLGGLANVQGVIVGGLVLGLAENVAGAYLSSSYKDVIAFLVLLLVLAIRPTGILSSRSEEKV